MRSNLLFKIIGTAVAVLLFITGLASGAAADPSDAKARDIRKLLEASGIYDQLNLMKNNLLNQYSMGFSQAYPKAPDAFWQEYYQLIGQQDIDALVERMIPVYDKNMSHEVIRKLIEMFETPFWEEWKVKMPAISREAGQIGSVWGQELLQSDAFNNSLKALIRNHGLEDLNE
ncbi:MAG: DUF2059 domain-containing protein [Nitrospinae bacterium]|nr:DUF2059 domain-containing protein [Nitrospinota bacterium]